MLSQEKRLEKLTLPKMSQMSRTIMMVEHNSESLALTKMRVENCSVTSAMETPGGSERKGKAGPTDQTNRSKGFPALQTEFMQV